jgi:hypothetical protein
MNRLILIALILSGCDSASTYSGSPEIEAKPLVQVSQSVIDISLRCLELSQRCEFNGNQGDCLKVKNFKQSATVARENREFFAEFCRI